MRLFLSSVLLMLALNPVQVYALLDDPVWLEVDGSQLPSWSYVDRTGAAKGGVVLLLGSGTSGAWPHSLASMGDYLPDHGWHTVSIRADFEMNDSTNLAKRVNAAIGALPVVAGKPIVVIAAHSIARHVALQQIEKGFSKQPSAFVFLNRPVFEGEGEASKFHKEQLAILDLSDGATTKAEFWRHRRNLAAENKQRFYKHVALPLTGPNWTSKPDRLGKKIIGWLKRSYP
ncbi:MAG: DUF3530 family protein [Pseudomonadales bacterium]